MRRQQPPANYPQDYGAQPPPQQRRTVFILVIALLASLLIISSAMLIRYASDYVSSRKGSDDLRKINQQAMAEEMARLAQATDAPASTSVPSQRLTAQVPAATAVPSQAQVASLPGILPSVRYPTNYYSIVTSRFKKIQGQNKDIIGWLNIAGVLDEAVVQRDNSYYLRRDYKGYHNQNGAIFLDENCNLKTRPYTMILYGHNMKTGAMFGCLRNFENPTYYHKNPMITFDTAYENGRYIIFAVGTISTIQGNNKYVNFSKLNSTTVAWRQEALDQLLKRSVYNCTVDVQPDDQLLLLMTCVDDSTERRVVAARRVRPGENEAALISAVKYSILK